MKKIALFLTWLCAGICIVAAVVRITSNQDGPAVIYGIGALVCIGIFVAIGENTK